MKKVMFFAASMFLFTAVLGGFGQVFADDSMDKHISVQKKKVEYADSFFADTNNLLAQEYVNYLSSANIVVSHYRTALIVNLEYSSNTVVSPYGNLAVIMMTYEGMKEPFSENLDKHLAFIGRDREKLKSLYARQLETARLLKHTGGEVKFNDIEVIEYIENDKKRHSLVKTEFSGKQKSKKDFGLNVYNSLWLTNTNDSDNKNFMGILNKYYFADINGEFLYDEFVKNKTSGKIESLRNEFCGKDYVISNIVSFKARLAAAFDKKDTASKPFYLADKSSVTVEMMHKEGDFLYAENDKVQILKMPYKKEDVSASMIFVLAKENDIKTAAKYVHKYKINEINALLSSRKVSVFIPKIEIKVEGTFQLTTDALKSIHGTLYNTHDAGYIKIDEEKAEAYAANMVCMMNYTAPTDFSKEVAEVVDSIINFQEKPDDSVTLDMYNDAKMPDKAVFNADRPFVCVIVDEKDGKVLFVNEIINPLEK